MLSPCEVETEGPGGTPPRRTCAAHESLRRKMNLQAADDCGFGGREECHEPLSATDKPKPAGSSGHRFAQQEETLEHEEGTSLGFVNVRETHEPDENVMISSTNGGGGIRFSHAADEGEGDVMSKEVASQGNSHTKRGVFEKNWESGELVGHEIADESTNYYDSDAGSRVRPDRVDGDSGPYAGEDESEDDDARSSDANCREFFDSQAYAHETLTTVSNNRLEDFIYAYATSMLSSSSPAAAAAAAAERVNPMDSNPSRKSATGDARHYSCSPSTIDSNSLSKLHLILRTGGALFSMITVALIFSTNETKTAAGNTFHLKFSDFQAYNYLLAFHLLTFLYSIGRLFISVRRGSNVLSSPLKAAAMAYGCDQMLAYFLMSCSSSAATASALSRNGLHSIWPPACSTWKLWMFCSMADSAVVMSFVSSLFVIISSFFSGYRAVVLLRE